VRVSAREVTIELVTFMRSFNVIYIQILFAM